MVEIGTEFEVNVFFHSHHIDCQDGEVYDVCAGMLLLDMRSTGDCLI